MVSNLRNKDIKKIVCGGSHNFAITSFKEVFTWGYGQCGRLGMGDEITYAQPVKLSFFNKMQVVDVACGPDHSVIMVEEGKLALFFESWRNGNLLDEEEWNFGVKQKETIFGLL